jgi:hypothetical protein
LKDPYNWIGFVFFLGLWFLVPIFLTRIVIGADWGTIAIAYLVWLAMLAAFAGLNLMSGIRLDESVGWPVIMSMFLTIPAIPVIAVIMRWTGLR